MSKVKAHMSKLQVGSSGLLLFTATFAFLLLISNFAYALALNVDPSHINMVVKPGETKSGEITVQNTGSSPVDIKVYTEDWVDAPDGSKTFMNAGSSVYSCSNWIKLSATKFQLDPMEENKLKFDLTAPKNSSGGHVSVVFFEAAVNVKEGIGVTGRIGTIVYQDTEGDILRTGEIKGFSVSGSLEGEPVTVTVNALNTGNTFISLKPKLTVTKDDKPVFENEGMPMNALPGEVCSGTFKVGKLAEGKYKVKAKLTCEGKNLESQAEFTISKK